MVPARCSSTVQVDLMRGKREGEGSLVTSKYEHLGRIRGHDFLECLPYRPTNSGGRAIPESRATWATTSLIARN